jgi:DNA primase
MLDRGFTRGDIKGLGFLWSSELWGRVVMPDYDNSGKLWFWVARSFFKNEKLRYKAPTSVDSGKRLYRYYSVKQRDPKKVIITEGAIDAGIAGDDAVASYGVGLKGDQALLLYNLHKPLLFAFDGDAVRYVNNWCSALISLGVPPSYLEFSPLPKKEDPASMGRVGFRKYIENNRLPYNKLNVVFSQG